MGCHFLLQRIFPTQGSNPGLPHCSLKADSSLVKPGVKLTFNRKAWVMSAVPECSEKSGHSKFSNAHVFPFHLRVTLLTNQGLNLGIIDLPSFRIKSYMILYYQLSPGPDL